MRLRISFEIRLTRERPPEQAPALQPEGAYATVETAPPHYPLGFSPNNVEAKDDAPTILRKTAP